VQVGGDDVRKSMVPLQLPGPSPVMFQILGLLIEAGREIASVKDVMTGDSGPRAMTATATMALIEQGMMVFSAAYKRVYQSMRREYKMLARLNAKHVTPEQYNAFLDGQGQFDPAADFDLSDMDITPVADPRAVTQMQKMAKAQLVKEMAGEGLVDPRVAARRILEAAAVDGVDELAPEPTPEDMQRQAMEAQQAQVLQGIALATAELGLMKVQAEIDKIKADTEKARASGVKDLAQADQASAGIRLAAMIETLRALRDEIAGTGGIGGMAGAPGDGMPVQPPAPRIEPAPPMDAGGLVGGGGGFGGGPQGLAGGFGDSGAVP
jgi:chaperonin GroES